MNTSKGFIADRVQALGLSHNQWVALRIADGSDQFAILDELEAGRIDIPTIADAVDTIEAHYRQLGFRFYKPHNGGIGITAPGSRKRIGTDTHRLADVLDDMCYARKLDKRHM